MSAKIKLPTVASLRRKKEEPKSSSSTPSSSSLLTPKSLRSSARHEHCASPTAATQQSKIHPPTAKKISISTLSNSTDGQIKTSSTATVSVYKRSNLVTSIKKKLEEESNANSENKSKENKLKFLKSVHEGASKASSVSSDTYILLGNKNESCWSEKYFPSSLEDHFVHKTKIIEVKTWLAEAKAGSICVLTGPTGCGKTATLYLLAKELNYHVKEWICPMSLTTYNPDQQNWTDDVRGKTILEQFCEFLIRSSQYKCLPIKGRENTIHLNSLVLVEDFPNFLFTEPETLHKIVRNYQKIGGSPLVFILSDCSSPEYSAYRLFPKALQKEIQIKEIQFNPVANSFLIKFVSSVVLKGNGEVTSDEILKEVATAAGGDVRSAINNLQFRIQKFDPVSNFRIIVQKDKNSAKKRKVDETKSTVSQLLGEKDQTIFLFHAIGKVLYCKRNPNELSETERCLNGSSDQRIHPLKENPEEIGDKIEVAPETFVNFLAQNYLLFFESVDDIVHASEYLSDVYEIFSHWSPDEGGALKTREIREEFGLCIAIRGLMFTNQGKGVKNSWKPLRKPGFTDINSRIKEMIENSRAHFIGPITEDYYTDLIPYICKFPSNNYSQAKKDFIKEYGFFSNIRRHNSENFQQDTDPDSPDVMKINSSSLTFKIQDKLFDKGIESESEEDYDIEEVED